MDIDAKGLDFKQLNDKIKLSNDNNINIYNCIGQRYIASGLSDKNINISGVPGNALGSYLDGSIIKVNGNSQDATGDTMNSGTIYVHGSCGDATGYAMRGGKIFVEQNIGYRAGIHMKAYKDKMPAIIVGGTAGSFLGEYQAGGIIIVLGLYNETPVIGNFCGTGMYGGKIYVRANSLPSNIPKQVIVTSATTEDMEEVKPYIQEFCNEFNKDIQNIMTEHFFVLFPDTNNKYKQTYTIN